MELTVDTGKGICSGMAAHNGCPADALIGLIPDRLRLQSGAQGIVAPSVVA